MTKFIGEVFDILNLNSNVPEDQINLIAMKSEFHLSRVILTKNKKSYAALILSDQPPNSQIRAGKVDVAVHGSLIVTVADDSVVVVDSHQSAHIDCPAYGTGAVAVADDGVA